MRELKFMTWIPKLKSIVECVGVLKGSPLTTWKVWFELINKLDLRLDNEQSVYRKRKPDDYVMMYLRVSDYVTFYKGDVIAYESIGQPDANGDDIYSYHYLKDKKGNYFKISWDKAMCGYELWQWHEDKKLWFWDNGVDFWDYYNNKKYKSSLAIAGTIHDAKFKEMFN